MDAIENGELDYTNTEGDVAVFPQDDSYTK